MRRWTRILQANWQGGFFRYSSRKSTAASAEDLVLRRPLAAGHLLFDGDGLGELAGLIDVYRNFFWRNDHNLVSFHRGNRISQKLMDSQGIANCLSDHTFNFL